MTDIQRFRLTVSVDYDAEVFDGDPGDMAELSDVERQYLYAKFEEFLETHVLDWDENSLVVETTPL